MYQDLTERKAGSLWVTKEQKPHKAKDRCDWKAIIVLIPGYVHVHVHEPTAVPGSFQFSLPEEAASHWSSDHQPLISLHTILQNHRPGYLLWGDKEWRELGSNSGDVGIQGFPSPKGKSEATQL